ncbi:unnamed protein product [Leptidea sinapis]|uniref:Uncharacterized protein n=1 Tax=Leptidea sinapis TaxID=189913 RepID=A0A5E4QLI4_9NEOP|nr:unnamed protein product [Leptidea sinapis]
MENSIGSALDKIKLQEQDTETKLKEKRECIKMVWDQRSNLCETIQNTSDKYDVWALLVRPTNIETPRVLKKPEPEIICGDARLREAMMRRDKAIAERDRLKREPSTGDEFIRSYVRYFKGRSFGTKNKTENVDDSGPIKFSSSGAAKRIPRSIFVKQKDMPWYQPYSVVGSVAAFLIYFCVLREESDIDQQFDTTLYDRVKGLEKHQLILSYKYNKEHGLSVAEIEQRLKELEEEEAKLVV